MTDSFYSAALDEEAFGIEPGFVQEEGRMTRAGARRFFAMAAAPQADHALVRQRIESFWDGYRAWVDERWRYQDGYYGA